MRLLLQLGVGASILGVLMSVYPGVLVDACFLGFFALAAAVYLLPVWAGIAIVVLFVKRYRRKRAAARDPLFAEMPVGKKSKPAPQRVWFDAVPVIGLGCCAIVVVGLPRYVAFRASLPAFDRQVTAGTSFGGQGEAPGRMLGVYYVDRCERDPRGGLFFRTHTGFDGIGPDQMSYGFAYRPNRSGSPFGNSKYRLAHITKAWYLFAASDDW